MKGSTLMDTDECFDQANCTHRLETWLSEELSGNGGRLMRKVADLPRRWKHRIHELTGLNFCDRTCGCGENNRLWWFPVTAAGLRQMPDWVPGWMNGGETFEIWKW